MGRVTKLQTSFNSGVLDPRLNSRVDIKQFYQGVSVGTNVKTLPQGGIKRRDGMAYIADIGSSARLVEFAFNVTQTYLMVFTNNNIAVYKDDVFQVNITTTMTSAEVQEMNWTQSADTLIIVHESHQPQQLVRGASHILWTLSNITLSNIPTYDFGSGAEASLSATRGWPKTVTFFESRLVFGGSTEKPQSIWTSKTNDFYNLDNGTGLADEGIFVTLDTAQVNAINGIYAGRHLQVLTTGGEFYSPTSPKTPGDFVIKRQTPHGSSGLRPVSVDGATLFVDRYGTSIRELLYTYVEEAYNADSISVMAPHLLNTPVDMAAQRGTAADESNYVYVVNTDGTMAVLNSLRSQEVTAWTKWETSGTIENIAVVVDVVYFLVKRTINSTTEYYLEKADPDTYTDSNIKQTITPSVTVTGLDHLDGEECRVKADGAVLTDNTPASGSITAERSVTDVEVGLNFNPAITTMPLNMDFQTGPTLTGNKRIVRVKADMYESLGVYIEGILLPTRKFGSDLLDQTPDPYTGLKEQFLNGWTELAQVTITQQDPLPMTILSLAVEVEVSNG